MGWMSESSYLPVHEPRARSIREDVAWIDVVVTDDPSLVARQQRREFIKR